jgi:hypothetical protein
MGLPARLFAGMHGGSPLGRLGLGLLMLLVKRTRVSWPLQQQQDKGISSVWAAAVWASMGMSSTAVRGGR